MVSEGVVVVGASGFGRECLDVLEAAGRAGLGFHIVGVVDDNPSPENLAKLEKCSISYLGTIGEWLAGATHDSYLLGIGDPRIRAMLVARMDRAGIRAATVVHPSATIGASTTMAEGVVVCAGVVISNNVRLDRHVHINPNATIGHDVHAAEFVSINPAAVISGDVAISSGTLVGAAATVLQHLSVGARCVIGAGAVVTKDVPSDVVVTGVPGRWAAPLTEVVRRPEQFVPPSSR